MKETPMNDRAVETVEVTQADREMAAKFVIECNSGGLASGHHVAYRNGEGDDSVLVRILARHRIASVAAARAAHFEEAAGIAEKKKYSAARGLDAEMEASNATADEIAQAIRTAGAAQ